MKFSFKLKPSELEENEISVPFAILGTIAISGILATAFVAPGTLRILRMFQKRKKYYCRARINTCLGNLIKKGLVIKNGDGKLFLSPKGELKLLKYQEELKPKRKWDKKWRIVIFDIWEKNRKKRDFLRTELKEFGFIKLQNSVWLTPYDCEDYVNLLKTDVGLGRSVVYIVAEKIDNEEKFKKVFKLS